MARYIFGPTATITGVTVDTHATLKTRLEVTGGPVANTKLLIGEYVFANNEIREVVNFFPNGDIQIESAFTADLSSEQLVKVKQGKYSSDGDDTAVQLAAATSTEVMAANKNRTGGSITNNSDQVVQVSYGEEASATSFSVALDPRTAAGQPVHYLEIPSWAVKLPIHAFSALVMSGDNSLLINEVTS